MTLATSVQFLSRQKRDARKDNFTECVLKHYARKTVYLYDVKDNFSFKVTLAISGARWLSGRVSDSGARGPGFETYRRRVVSLSKTLYSPKVLVNYPGSDGSVPT